MNVISDLIEAHIFKRTKNGLKFLLLKRAETEIFPGIWQMVTGKIKKNEKAFETVLREIKEETDLKPVNFWTVPLVNSFYSHSINAICMVPVFAVEIDESAEVIISEEHSDFIWVSRKKAKELLAWPGQRNSVDIICEYISDRKSFLKFVKIDL